MEPVSFLFITFVFKPKTLKFMKKYMWAGVWLVATMLVSCGGLQSFTFDQLYPAEVTFPEQVRTVAVVNHAPSIPSPKKTLLTVGRLDGDGKVLAENLAGGLADSRYFNQVVISDSVLTPEKAGGELLSRAVVDSLTQVLGADMIFSIDRIQLQTAKKEIYYPGFMPVVALDLKVRPVVRAYIPSRLMPVMTLNRVDSLLWDWDPMLSDHEVVNDASSYAASTLVNQLVPHWKSVDRVYFDGGSPDMRDAAVSLREGDWQEASRIWKDLYDSAKKGKQKSRAAFNLALACEVQGKMEDANFWINEALKNASPGSDEERAATFYATVLKARTKDFQILNLQMQRFGNNFN